MNLIVDTYALLWLFDECCWLVINRSQSLPLNGPENRCCHNAGSVGCPQFTALSVSRVNTIIGNTKICISDNHQMKDAGIPCG
jgi:hypothetical protein